MKKYKLLITLFTFLAAEQLHAFEDGSYVPPSGFVPTEEVAIQIAISTLSPIYGEDKIKKERPFKAVLSDDIWTITGSVPKGKSGGAAFIKIAKIDGRILFLKHGK